MSKIIISDDEAEAIVADITIPLECDNPACKKIMSFSGKMVRTGFTYKCKFCNHVCKVDEAVFKAG